MIKSPVEMPAAAIVDCACELAGILGIVVVLCPDTDLEQTVKRAERIRMAIARLRIPDLQERTLTASFGVGSS